MSLSVTLSEYHCSNCFYTYSIRKQLTQLCFRIGKRPTQWALVPPFLTIKIFHKHENVTNIIKMKQKNSRDTPNGSFCPLGRLFYPQPKHLSKHRQQNGDFLLKVFYHSLNNCKGLNQQAFIPLGSTITYTTSNLINLRNFLATNQCIDVNRYNHKNGHPCHNLPQACWGSKYVCLVLIRPTSNLKSHLRTSFRINERLSNKYDTQN